MAFLKGIKKAIEIPVTILIPGLNEKDEEVALELKPVVQYKKYKRSDARKVQVEVAKISKAAADAFEAGDVESLFSERLQYFDDLLIDSVVGWRGMMGEDDEEIPFSKEVLEEAVEDNEYFTGLMAGLRRAMGWGDDGTVADGSEGEETKNS